MTPEAAANAVEQARKELEEFGRVRTDLPRRIMVAWQLGISKNEISQLTTCARTTITRILRNQLRPAEAEAFAQYLRGELTSAASRVEPRPGLGQIRRRIRKGG